MKTLGIIGGLGPMATVYYMQLIVQMTKAETDQQHLEMIVMNSPSVPDRTAYILDKSKPSPLPPIMALAKRLEELGAGCLAIPCITSHYFYREFSESVNIPFLNIVAETAKHLKQNGIRKAGILATLGTVRTKLFQDALQEQGIEAVVPDEKHQAMVMSLIYDFIKAGKKPDLTLFHQAACHLQEKGAQCSILGCTELSLLKRDFPIGDGFLDAVEVLAKASILACHAPLREEYTCLISGKQRNDKLLSE